MLILNRRVHQEVHIGNAITITIVAVRGKQVRLGIKAPPDVPIRRDELPPLPGSGRPATADDSLAGVTRAPAACEGPVARTFGE